MKITKKNILKKKANLKKKKWINLFTIGNMRVKTKGIAVKNENKIISLLIF